MATEKNFNTATPAAPTGARNSVWQLSGTPSGTDPTTGLPVFPASCYQPDMIGDAGSGGADGLVPAPGPGTAASGMFLKADATWAIPPGTGGGGGTSVSFGAVPPSANPVQSLTSGTTSLVFSSAVTSGNIVIVAYKSEGTITSSTVSDTLGTTYTQVASISGQSNNMNIYVGTLTASGANTITIGSPANNFDRLGIMEVANCTATVDVTATAYQTSSPSTTSITTTNAVDFIFAAVAGFHNVNTFSFSAPFVLSAQSNGNDANAIGYDSVVTTGTYSLVVTLTGAADNQPVILVALKSNLAAGSEGDIYFNTSTAPYSGFVFHDGIWKAFS
jgi:hypothetical protein